MNRIIIHGRLTRDPETRQTGSGTSVTNFSVAVDRGYKGENGEKQTDFFECTAWRERGETIAKYFSKGKEIVVEGSMESRKYTDKDGINRTAWGITVSGFDFCGKKEAGESSDGGFRPAGAAVDVDFTEVEDDGELPF